MKLEHTTQGVDPVWVFHSDTTLVTDLCHRIRFLDYPAIDFSDAQALGKQDPSLTAIITDPESHAAMRRGASRHLRKLLDSTPTLLLAESSEQRQALSGRTDGPIWPVELPLKRARLAHLLSQAAQYRGCQRRQRLTGTSASIAKVRRLIEQVAGFDTNVLVTGESGTGKELVARTIHDLSSRVDRPFVPINCGAIPGDLLESELFGHKKGAFTGAVSDRQGRFELAEGGTLFLDEIGDMAMPMQVKLLRVLQERTFQPVGSSETRVADVRIVAATHRDLNEAVERGEFREDLYYRLNVFPIEMPALRKRLEDIPGLLRELVLGYEHRGSKKLRLQTCALNALAGYAWPGNVRELGNLVERLAILHPTGVVRVDDLPEKYRVNAPVTIPSSQTASMHLPESGLILKEHLQKIERSLIDSALERSNGVVARAARMLNMRRTTLVEKLRVA
ncbi:MAG: sigma-54 dependent transcriptional regulator [Pseudomonadota bacterium]